MICLFVLCLAVLSVFSFYFVDSVFAETYSLQTRVSPSNTDKNSENNTTGLPAGVTYCDLTSNDTLDVTAVNAQIFLSANATLDCNIDISGIGYGNEKTGKIRLCGNSSTISHLTGIVNLKGDTAIGSHIQTDAFGTLYFDNQIIGDGGLFVCAGTASPVYLNNATSNSNNYKGNTQLGHPAMHKYGSSQPYAGIVYLNADEQIPDVNTAGSAAVGNLIINSYISSQPSKLYLNGHTETVNGLVSSDAYSIITGTSGSKLIVGANNATSTYTGKLQDAMQLEKIGTGTLTLSGTNTYSGETTISAGTLILTGTGTLGTGAVTNNGSLELCTTATITPNISGTGNILVSAGTVTLTGAVNQTGGATTLGDGITLSIGNNSTLYNLSGGDEDSPATLSVNGNLTLNNDDESTFIGSITARKITVDTANEVALKLYAGANNKVTADSLTVSSGELDFRGYFEGSIEVFNGSIFSPGNSIGEADITGNITFTSEDPAISNGVAWFEFGEYADGADVNHDLFVMKSGGTFTADDGVILLDFANNDADSWAAVGNSFKLVSNGGFADGEDYSSWLAITPDYSNLFKLTGGADGLYLVGIKAAPEPGSGVPEPSTWALLLLGAAGLLYVRKRNK